MARQRFLGSAAHLPASTSGSRAHQCRCLKLALVHDVAEAIVGDITPTCGVSDEEKFRLEAEAVQRMRGMLGATSLAGGCCAVLPPSQCLLVGLIKTLLALLCA